MAGRTRLPAGAAVALGLALSLRGGGGAFAVDLPPAPDLPAASAAEDFSGWYLRGDVGAGFEAPPNLAPAAGWTAAAAIGSASTGAVGSFRGAALSPSGTIDAGVGYVLNSWFRTDATLEYRFGGSFSSLYSIADPAHPFDPVLASGRIGAGVSSLVALLNGYVDLGNFWGMTPFVGAGIGVADNALSGVSDAGFALNGAGAAVPTGGLFANGAATNVAFALMAGIDVDLAQNLKLEIGYRYLNLGSVALGAAHCVAGPPACSGAAVAARSRGTLASNDVRVGLVLLVGEPPPAPAPLAARY